MKFKRAICLFISLIILSLSFSIFPAYAEGNANSYISVSQSQVKVGDRITVSVNVVSDGPSVGCVDGTLTYHESVVEFVSAESANGSSGSVRISAYDATNTEKNMLVVMTFEAIGTGTTYFTFTPNEVTDTEENPLTCSSSAESVKVVNEELSDNANLSSIRVSSGTLSPSFSANTQSYTVNVSNSVSEVVISASAVEDDADVSISGDDYVEVGENERVITVTAPNGEATKEYYIIINRSKTSNTSSASSDTSSVAENDLTVTIGSQKYTVVSTVEKDLLPKGFSLSKQYYNNIEVDVAYNSSADITLFYLTDSKGENAFYTYNDETGEFYPYLSLKSNVITLSLLDKPTVVEIPEHFKETVLEVSGVSYKAWKLDYKDYRGIYLVYGMTDTGETGLYMYDSTENTLQKYIEIIKEVKFENKNGEKIQLYMFIGLISLAVITVALFIVIVILCKKHREYKF